MFGFCKAHPLGVLEDEGLLDHRIMLAVLAEGCGLGRERRFEGAEFFGGGDDTKKGYTSRDVESDHRDKRQQAERTIEHDACSFSRDGLLVGDLEGDSFGRFLPEGTKRLIPFGGEFALAELDVRVLAEYVALDLVRSLEVDDTIKRFIIAVFFGFGGLAKVEAEFERWRKTQSDLGVFEVGVLKKQLHIAVGGCKAVRGECARGFVEHDFLAVGKAVMGFEFVAVGDGLRKVLDVEFG